jgi:hypothetical protein
MPLQATSGAASQDGFGGNGVPVVIPYIEDVFQTWLYTGTGASRSITNNIDLSTKGGLVWIKDRGAANSHALFDTARGASNYLNTNGGSAQNSVGGETTTLTAFNTTGFSLGTDTPVFVNTNTNSYVSWTFRKQPKFFDVVTYSGTGANRTIAHNLGSVPACIIVKRTDDIGDWQVYHSSLANTQYLVLNKTNAVATGATRWNSTTPTSTVFSVGTDTTVNNSAGTYVAYLFASNAGGFGLTETDNVITCGSYTGNGSATGPTVTLGYEPQWLMIKKSSAAGGNWQMIDNMRGMTVGIDGFSADLALQANLSNAETSADYVSPTATGFQITTTDAQFNTNAATFIYIAIRRGPMKVPTDATKVFIPIARTGTGTVTSITGFGFSPDLLILADRTQLVNGLTSFISRLTNVDYYQITADSSESGGTGIASFDMDGVSFNAGFRGNSVTTWMNQYIKRAPSFFDIVCYKGTGSNTTVSHNLKAIPELIICKRRDDVGDWNLYSSALANTEYVVLNTNAAKATGATRWNSTTPTSSVFSVGTSTDVNASAGSYVAYLFSTCAGVSKVGSYTGTGALQTVNCGFSSGARLVIIKRTDSTGDWYIFDSARGITSGNDPYLLLNSATAESTITNYVDTDTTGFKVTAAAPAGLNASGGTYIFLAIA